MRADAVQAGEVQGGSDAGADGGGEGAAPELTDRMGRGCDGAESGEEWAWRGAAGFLLHARLEEVGGLEKDGRGEA